MRWGEPELSGLGARLGVGLSFLLETPHENCLSLTFNPGES